MQTSDAKEMLGDQYDAFLTRFVSEGDALAEWLNTPPLENEELRQRCHKIASTAGLFGAAPFQKALQHAETLVKTGEDIPAAAITDILDTWEEVKATLATP